MTQCKINVMHLISSLELGGAEKLLVEFLKAGHSDDVVNYVIVIMNQAINPILQEELERLGYTVYYLNRAQGHLHLKYWIKLIQIIYRHHVHIVHAHNYGSKMWAAFCKVFYPRLKIVFTVHETMSIAQWNWLQLVIHKHWINTNIAISNSVSELCLSKKIRNLKKISNGIVISDQKITQNGSRDKFRIRLVHVGRLDYAVKGQDVLLRALALCKQEKIPVFCQFLGGSLEQNKKFYEELLLLARSLDLEQETEFIFDQTQVSDFLKSSDLFVMPSIKEGFGLALLEAMALGLPVIASDIQGPAELVQNFENGLLFQVGNEYALAKAIRFIYKNPEIALKLAENGYDFAKQFDIKNMKSEYVELYTELMSQCDFKQVMESA